MKTSLLLILLFCSQFSICQDLVLSDSIQERIQLFQDSITKIIEQYEADSIDFIAVRSNVNYGPNCQFIIRKDSCTRMHILHLDEESLVGYIEVVTIASRVPNDKRHHCPKELDEAYWSLTHYEDYFTKEKPDYSLYDPDKIIFFGSVNGRYMHEVVEKDYFSTHHYGMFYDYFKGKY